MTTQSFTTSETTSRTRTMTYTLPNLKSINNVSVNTGNVQVSNINKEQVSVQMSGGVYTKRVQTGGSAGDSKWVTDQGSSYYSSGGYSGSLSSYVAEAADSKTITNQYISNKNDFPSTRTYNENGYSGTLTKNGSPSVISGSLTPSDTKFVTEQTNPSYNSGGYVGALSKYVYSGSLSYVQDYSDIIYRSDIYPKLGDIHYINGKTYKVTGYGDGTTQLMAIKEVDTRVYRYQGNVTRPESDTRQWQQSYSGSVTKPAVIRYQGTVYYPDTRTYDYYYKYTVTFDYIDNANPILTLTDSSNTLITQGQVIRKRDKSDFLFRLKPNDADAGDTIEYTLWLNNAIRTNWTVISKGVEFDYLIPYEEMVLGNTVVKIQVRDDKGGSIERDFVLRSLSPESDCQQHVYDLIVVSLQGF
jgi:hypothetical protein